MTFAPDKYLPLADGRMGKHTLTEGIFSDDVQHLARADQAGGAVVKRETNQQLRAHKAGMGVGVYNQNQPTARRITLSKSVDLRTSLWSQS